MKVNQGTQQVPRVVASYGVYHHDAAGLRVDETGDPNFMPYSEAYRNVVVNESGDSRVVRLPHHVPENAAHAAEQSPTALEQSSCWFFWCRPSILLLILVLLVIILVFVSGILLYYNCTLICLHAWVICVVQFIPRNHRINLNTAEQPKW